MMSVRRAFGAALFVALTAPMAAGQDGDYEPPRTPWGDPDFRGYYLPGASQPMETAANDSWRPAEGVNRRQGAAFSRSFEPDPAAPPRPGRIARPMVIDPPDGRIPFQPWASERRGEVMARQESPTPRPAPPQSRKALEMLFGGGYLFREGDMSFLPSIEVGVAGWWSDSWGMAIRRSMTVGEHKSSYDYGNGVRTGGQLLPPLDDDAEVSARPHPGTGGERRGWSDVRIL